MAKPSQATELLLSLGNGNRAAMDQLLPLVYDELRAIARRRLKAERIGHTLTTTALVHEAYLKLIKLDRMQWQSRAHFLAIAAHAMRNILVTYALRRKRLKRGGGASRVPLEEAAELPIREADRILALDAALDRLTAHDERHARIVECRFFSGMTIEETAIALDISPATVKRDWTLLRAWLARELSAGG
jgi:RNA polymerase sigma factor (TIGR02999 family)